MSVIIKGMDMPKSCFLCGLKTRGMCPILIKRVCATDRKVDENCPLEPADQISKNQKTGKWIGDWFSPKCSVCGEKPLYERYYGVDGEETHLIKSHYCPNCGAKMEGE